MPSLLGKSAIVTGGSRGIGACIARRLAEEGCDVAITFLAGEAAAARVVEDINLSGRSGMAIRSDSANPSDIKSAIDQVEKQFHRIDIIVNNSGYIDQEKYELENMPLNLVDKTIAINLRASLLYVQYALRHMTSGGRIINIGSCLSRRVPSPGLTVYAMTKAGISGLTKGLARDLALRGITVNEISPGPIDTDMNPTDGPSADFQRSLTAVGRFGTGNDIAEVVLFLAGEQAAFITGANFAVDGGTNI